MKKQKQNWTVLLRFKDDFQGVCFNIFHPEINVNWLKISKECYIVHCSAYVK